MHGEKDSVVPYDQYELMMWRAQNADIPRKTPSFEEVGYEQAYYDAPLDFLGRHNPAD